MAKRMKKQTPAEIRKVLRAAAKDDQVVKVHFDEMEGSRRAYVIEVSKDLLLYVELDLNSMEYEGPNVARLSSVLGVSVDEAKVQKFYALGPMLLGHEKPTVPKIRLTSMAAVLTDFKEHYLCIWIEAPSEVRGACWIGNFWSVNRTTLQLFEINPDGRWKDDWSYFPIRAITHVKVNNGYVNALWLVANHLGKLEAEASDAVAEASPKKARKSH